MKKLIILYIVDALRADHLGCYGYCKHTTPQIDQLAKEGVLFQHIYSQSTETKSSAATLSTSTYLSVHDTTFHGDILPAQLFTQAQSLRAAGFTTAAFNTNVRLSREFGFDRGFDHYFDLQNQPGFDNVKILPDSKYLNQKIIKFLNEIQADNVFVQIWSMDAHLPFVAPQEWQDKFLDKGKQLDGNIETVLRADSDEKINDIVGLYDAEISYNDFHIGELIRHLKTENLWDETTFILTSDHGEAFMEHGQLILHGGAPYREITHVPLIVKSPGLPQGVNQNMGGLIDLMPTILGLAGIRPPETAQGMNMLDTGIRQSLLFSQARPRPGIESTGVLDTRYKLIRTTSPVKQNLKQKLFPRKTTVVARLPIDDDILHDGVPGDLFKKARIKKIKTEALGQVPRLSWKLIPFIKALVMHFLGDYRYELFDTRQDPFEQRNLIASEQNVFKRLRICLNEFDTANMKHKQNMAIRHQAVDVDHALTERLRDLGYLD